MTFGDRNSANGFVFKCLSCKQHTVISCFFLSSLSFSMVCLIYIIIIAKVVLKFISCYLISVCPILSLIVLFLFFLFYLPDKYFLVFHFSSFVGFFFFLAFLCIKVQCCPMDYNLYP